MFLKLDAILTEINSSPAYYLGNNLPRSILDDALEGKNINPM
jgi:hypothetical protein